MDTVWLLWFEQEREGGDDTELLIGVYRTEGDANAAVERLKGQPGFRDYPALSKQGIIDWFSGNDHSLMGRHPLTFLPHRCPSDHQEFPQLCARLVLKKSSLRN
jgi:hypothetical protein